MSRKRASMRKIKEVLRLACFERFSERQIVQGANVRKTTVHDYLLRARAAGLTWQEAEQMDDVTLERLLFPVEIPQRRKRIAPDWRHVHQELRRKHVTLQLLWEEYRQEIPDGYGYSRFCDLYSEYARSLDISMRQVHKAGEKVFVDYAGMRVEVVNPVTGDIREAEIFVAVLGASNYTYADASWSQRLPDWIGSHVRAMAFFGGVPEMIVPDNLKSGVTKPCYYDPEINPTYRDWAEQYNVAILPARVRHPKDKSKVEAGVLLVERWILARLRNRTFFSLAELNEVIAGLLGDLNQRPFRKLEGSRASMFMAVDKPALGPLPAAPYEPSEWKKARVNIDYHVAWEDHFYSVPYRLSRQLIELRATSDTIEILHHGVRVAAHARSDHKYGYTTIAEHMPVAHRAYAEWTPARLMAWGKMSSAEVASMFEAIMARRAHPEQGFRSCLGIMRLEKKVGRERLSDACRRALAIGGISYKSVRTILANKQEQAPLPSDTPPVRSIHHNNLRGAEYYRRLDTEERFAGEVRHAAASHH
jgi:transposase